MQCKRHGPALWSRESALLGKERWRVPRFQETRRRNFSLAAVQFVVAPMKILTTDPQTGLYNGYLVEIWSALQRPELQPAQVYLTAVAPHSRKGPHLHMVRRGLFCCVSGNVRIVRRNDTGMYLARSIGSDSQPVEVPPGIACAIYNYGDEEALVLNMPAPAWSKEEPDEWPVEGWQDPADWPPQFCIECGGNGNGRIEVCDA